MTHDLLVMVVSQLREAHLTNDSRLTFMHPKRRPRLFQVASPVQSLTQKLTVAQHSPELKHPPESIAQMVKFKLTNVFYHF